MTDRRKETLARLVAQLPPGSEQVIREVLGVRAVRVVPVEEIDLSTGFTLSRDEREIGSGEGLPSSEEDC